MAWSRLYSKGRPCACCWPQTQYRQKLTFDVVLQAPYSQHSHHKSQTFVVQKGYAIEQPCIVGEPEPIPARQHLPQDTSQQPPYEENAKPAVNMSRTPKWIENDGKASS